MTARPRSNAPTTKTSTKTTTARTTPTTAPAAPSTARSATARHRVPVGRFAVAGLACATLALGLSTTGALAGSGPEVPVRATLSSGPGDTPLKSLLAGLPDDVTDAAVVRVSGGGPRAAFTGAAGPVAGDARFPVGSVTKVFTDTLVLGLTAEQGIGIDQPVRWFLPDLVPAAYHGVTIRMLLDHTSDLPRAARVRLGPEALVRASFARDAGGRSGRTPAPGTAQQYNGLNSFLAGVLVERLAGRPYADVLADRILTPLGLTRTGMSAQRDVAWAWAEGGLESTTADLDRFLSALLGGQLLPPAAQRHLFEIPDVPGAPGNTSCPSRTACFSAGGLMRVRLSDGSRVWGKTGSLGGWTSGVFASAEQPRPAAYALRPDAKAGPGAQRDRVFALVDAAL
ncbi:serine hydrolase domain-containing protein [Streptomyces sp. NPDC101118]|uniref:serine hydrolase domain-containing protein n=1 Tax=Streptomyces sp. NPDC101118 TaxID=3366109 RepID=UPI0037F7D568